MQRYPAPTRTQARCWGEFGAEDARDEHRYRRDDRIHPRAVDTHPWFGLQALVIQNLRADEVTSPNLAGQRDRSGGFRPEQQVGGELAPPLAGSDCSGSGCSGIGGGYATDRVMMARGIR
jgi:hypothetical protein